MANTPVIEGVTTGGAAGRNCVGINPIVSLLQAAVKDGDHLHHELR